MTRSLLMCLLIALLLTAPAAAQVLPLVTDPITTPELMRYADLLALSDQQRLSLLNLHDDYKQRYRQFEDSEIRKLQDELLNVAMHFIRDQPVIPPRDQLEDLLGRYRRVHRRAGSIDRTLFDAITAILTEQQLVQLQSARTARALLVYGNPVRDFLGEMNEGAGVNLADLLRDIELTASERETALPVVIGYEGALLAETHDAYEALFEAAKLILDIIDEFGLRDMDRQEMITWISNEQTQASLKSRFDEASKPLQTAAHEMSQLNLTTFRRFKPALGPDSYAALRTRYYTQAYGIVRDAPGPWRDRFEQALRFQQLTPDQRQALVAQRDDFVRRDDQIVDRFVQVLEGWREYRTFDQFADEPDEWDRREDEYTQQRKALAQRAEDALAALLGPELMANLDQAPADVDQAEPRADVGDRAAAGEAAPAASGTRQTADADEPSEIDDPFRPPALARDALDALAVRLDWSDDQTLVLDSLDGDYRAQYQALRQAEYQAAPGNKQDEADDQPPPSVSEKHDRFKALLQVDDTFFDNVALLIDDAPRARILTAYRAMRRRTVLGDLARRIGRWWNQPEGYVDLASIVSDNAADRAVEPAVWTILDDYANRMLSLAENRADAAVEAYRRRELADRLRRRDPVAYQRMREGFQERRAEARRQLRDANTEIVIVNRQTLDRLLAELPDTAAWELRYAYNRVAYPGIFNDRSSAEPCLTAALTRLDLTSDQRDRIGEIAADFRARYFDLSERMVQLRRARDFDWMDFRMPEREDIEREIRQERLRFDRDELNERTKLRLRLALSEEQVRQVPGLR